MNTWVSRVTWNQLMNQLEMQLTHQMQLRSHQTQRLHLQHHQTKNTCEKRLSGRFFVWLYTLSVAVHNGT